ncbi:hypothetical protein AB4341_17750 [Vibrio breoganii]
MMTNIRPTSVKALVNELSKHPKLKVSAYKQLVGGLSNDLRIQAYKICMQDSSLAHHATGIQRTYFKGMSGGFEENIGGNGAMGTYKMK